MERVVVLHSEVSPEAGKDELDVLVQTEAVSQALRELGYEPVAAPFTLDLGSAVDRLRMVRPAFVFNLVETLEGSGRLIAVAPTLLDHLGVAYTGSSSEALFSTSNKWIAKKLLQATGIPTPSGVSLSGPDRKTAMVSGTYIIKSVWEHASIGLDEGAVLSTQDRDELFRTMEQRRVALGGQAFAERYIEGREFNVSILAGRDGPECLPPAEIEFTHFPAGKRKLVDYRAKWETDSFEYHHTIRRFAFEPADEPLLDTLSVLARACWDCFDLHGYARVDFRVDEHGAPWVLEVNANPCLSPDAGFVAAAARRGLFFNDVIERITSDLCGTTR